MTVISPERFRQALEGANRSQSDLARYLGVTPAAVQQIASGRTKRSVHLSRIAKYLAVSEDWLTGRTDDWSRRPTPEGGLVHQMAIVELDGETEDSLGPFTSVYYDIEVFPAIDSSPAAMTNVERGRWVMFNRIGDDMAPTFKHDDLVIVDTAATALDDAESIWLIEHDGRSMFRRIARTSSTRVRIYADHPRVPPVEATLDEMRVVGRAVWHSHLLVPKRYLTGD